MVITGWDGNDDWMILPQLRGDSVRPIERACGVLRSGGG